jgi:hypothetical protein
MGFSAMISLSVMHAPKEIMPLVRELRDKGWQITVLIGWRGMRSEQFAAGLIAEGYRVRLVSESFAYAEPRESSYEGAESFRKSVKRRIPRAFLGLLEVIRYCLFVRKEIVEARRILDEVNPDLVLMNNFHSCGRFDNALFAAAKERGIGTACVLVSPLVGKAIARPGRLTQYYSGMMGDVCRTDHSLTNRLVARFFPEWTVSDESTSLLMFPGDQLLGTWLSGILPKDIWQVPLVDFDAVFAPNEFSLGVLERGGFPCGKVFVFGPPRLDDVIAQLQDPKEIRSLYVRLGIPFGTPFLLWNVEPSFEHHYCSKEAHFRNFEGIRNIILDIGVPTMISLHPLCRLEDYLFAEHSGRIVIAHSLGIETLYPYCGFSLSFPCSSNQFAPFFKKKVIMYDWFGVRDDPRRWALYRQPDMEVATTQEQLRLLLIEECRQQDWETCRDPRPDLIPASRRIANRLAEMVSDHLLPNPRLN